MSKAARRCEPYLRPHKGLGGVLVILTKPAQEALCVLPDGSFQWRALSGVSAATFGVGDVESQVTAAQRAIMEALEPIWP